MNLIKTSVPHRTSMRHIHPALEYETHVSPLRFDVFFDGLELGTVYTYNKVEELGRDWLNHLLDEDALDVPEAHMAQCPHTGWWIMPLDTIETGKAGIVWFLCPCCDFDENVRGSEHYNAAHPGVHLLDLTRTPPPPVYAYRHEVLA